MKSFKYFFVCLLLTMLGCSKEEDTPPPPTKYNVSISLNPTEGGTVSPNGGQFNEGQTVSFNATASENYIFTNWSGSDTSSNNPLSLTINSNKTLTANFEKKDTDGDGVTDDLDQCPNTLQGVGVDNNGCPLPPIRLHENGITIVAESWAEIGETYEINGKQITVVDEEELRRIVGIRENLSIICTTLVTDMSRLFYTLESYGSLNDDSYHDISSWDVSNVVNMSEMFISVKGDWFKADISNWDVSRVIDMSGMFASSWFNGDISKWNTSSVTNMHEMFHNSYFNQPIGDWDVSNVKDMSGMFGWAKSFNQPIGDWDVSNVETMRFMFSRYDRSTPFNQDIGDWDVSSVKDFRGMFYKKQYDFNLSNWNTSSATNMSLMFHDTYNDLDLSSWEVSKVTDCSGFGNVGVRPNFPEGCEDPN